MAFNVNAQPDSSDEDGGDLAVWGLKNTAMTTTTTMTTAHPAAPASVAPMTGSSSEAPPVVRETALDSARKRQKTVATTWPVAPSLGFKAINAPLRAGFDANSTYSLDSDASPEPDTLFVEEEEKKLVVQVSRTEADEISDYQDLRAGADRVRQLLSEHSYADGTVLYKVQFADFHDEDVSPLTSIA